MYYDVKLVDRCTINEDETILAGAVVSSVLLSKIGDTAIDIINEAHEKGGYIVADPVIVRTDGRITGKHYRVMYNPINRDFDI